MASSLLFLQAVAKIRHKTRTDILEIICFMESVLANLLLLSLRLTNSKTRLVLIVNGQAKIVKICLEI